MRIKTRRTTILAKMMNVGKLESLHFLVAQNVKRVRLNTTTIVRIVDSIVTLYGHHLCYLFDTSSIIITNKALFPSNPNNIVLVCHQTNSTKQYSFDLYFYTMLNL